MPKALMDGRLLSGLSKNEADGYWADVKPGGACAGLDIESMHWKLMEAGCIYQSHFVRLKKRHSTGQSVKDLLELILLVLWNTKILEDIPCIVR